MTLTLESDAFGDGEAIPPPYTCDGDGSSVPLSWSGAPDGTKGFALICDDPDAPGGTFSHWAIWHIPATRTDLPAGLADAASVDGMHQGVNDFGNRGYDGPAPPDGRHTYRFKCYALEQRLDLPTSASKRRVGDAMRDARLAQTQLTGTYAP